MKKVMVIMRRLTMLLLIIFILAGCSKDAPVQNNGGQNNDAQSSTVQNNPSNTASGEEVKKDIQETQFLLVSEKFGFSLEAPGSWKGRVEISEENNSFMVKHVTISKEAPVKSPIIINIIEYGSVEKWEQDSKKKDEPFPYEKLGEIDGKVFAYIPPFDFPYDDNSPEDLKEYTEMMSLVEKVLKSFKPANNQETAPKQETAQGGNKYSAAGIDDPAGFEKYFYEVQELIARDDREAVARNLNYPVDLNINNKTVTIKNVEEMLQQYDTVFTQDVKKAVAEQKVENLFVNANGIMVGNGQIWFGAAEGEKYFILSVNP